MAQSDIFEASFDESGTFYFYGKHLPIAEPLPPIVLSGLAYPIPDHHLLLPDGRLQFYLDGLKPAGDATLAFGGAMVPVTGRLSSSGPARFADRTVTRHGTAATPLTDAKSPSMLIVSTRLPSDPLASFLPVAALAAHARRDGYRVDFLHHGSSSAFDLSVAALLDLVDVAHHVTTPPLPPDATAWEFPPAAAALRTAFDVVVTAKPPTALLFAEPCDLALAKGGDISRVILLDRAAVTAPLAIASPTARKKSIGSIASMLAGVTVLVGGADLDIALRAILPAIEPQVFRFDEVPSRLVADMQVSPDATHVLCIGARAQAFASTVADVASDAVAVTPTTSYDAVLQALLGSRAVLASSDAGASAAFAIRVANALQIPVWSDISAPWLEGPFVAEGSHLGTSSRPADPTLRLLPPIGIRPGRIRVGHRPLVERRRPGAVEMMADMVLTRALRVRIAQTAGRPIGILLPPDSLQRARIVKVLATLGDRIVRLSEARPTPADRLLGVRPLLSARAFGLEDVIVAEDDPTVASEATDRVAAYGLSPLPLFPGALPVDRRELAALADTREGAIAYVGSALPDSGYDIVLAAGESRYAADAVELEYASDARRGRLWTVFRAEDWRFWDRPPPPAIGIDLGCGDGIFGLLQGGAEGIDLMAAFALHLGCGRIAFDAVLRDDAPFRARLAALGLNDDRLLWHMPISPARQNRRRSYSPVG